MTRLLARDDVEVARHAGAPASGRDRPFPARRTIDRGPTAEARRPGLAGGVATRPTASVARRLDALLADEPDLTPYDVAGAVSRALPAEGLLVVGASSPIRDLDLMARALRRGRAAQGDRQPRPLRHRRHRLAPRSAPRWAGPRSSRALALMGDVTFLHDSNGLVLGPDEPRPDLTIVVVNDDGGSIFTMLEQGAPAYADRFERLFGTPHGVDLASLCAATRTPHWRVDSWPSSSTRWPAPTAASRSSRPASAATTGASST